MSHKPKEIRVTGEARCVNCGCTDSAACDDGCYWLWVDYDIGEGRCSACPVDDHDTRSDEGVA